MAVVDPRRHREQIVRNVGVQPQESMLQDRITVTEALGLFASSYPAAWTRGHGRRRGS
jgi:ABC-2 type transport system ATP-binding protein